ncbi:Lytic transglycosylase catalytic [Spirochaeta thermophila DSM 6578]|uniref:Lytic transglycosylase catalytic n=1 Tax=Winmispira thermophila (strain ATCC 700085 / DSM 6578 / Z-1203) TaxID=869211 RepID=G0GDR6_WINT7|nr:transglycosylase SLT domain-containing protein [Spirochaeta thermophila]AEJ62196.1 Lytic transglycosylase catalytic [Spirochaeta thermophila DSM 6578]
MRQILLRWMVLGGGILLLSCTEVPYVQSPGEWMPLPQRDAVSPEDRPVILSLLEEAHEERAPALFLYREELTRPLVEDFFINLTGDPEVALPILRYADKFDVPLFLAFSLAYVESEFYPFAVNENPSSVDRGLFQLNSRTFPFLTEEEFFDPEINARYGISYLKYCLEEGGSEVLALAMYNAGKHRVFTRGAPAMTLRYIDKFFAYRTRLEKEFFSYLSSVIRPTDLERFFKTELGRLQPVDMRKPSH